MTDPRIIKPEEIAQRLGVCRITVYRMLNQGQIPAIHAGKKWLVSRQAYERWENTIGERVA